MLKMMEMFTLIFLLCLTSIVRCDEQPVELSPGGDIKKLSAPTESISVESNQELKSKDGDTLDTLASMQTSAQTKYDYLSKPAVPPLLNLESYNTGVQQHSIISQYDSQSHSDTQQPHSSPVVFRYSNNGESTGAGDDEQTVSYIRQEPQRPIFEQKSYLRSALLDSTESSIGSSIGKGYKLPDLPSVKPGISTTYNSPEVKIVSHSRSFLPTIYNKETTDNGDEEQSSSAEQEYDKAVEERPGGSFSQSDSYESDSRRPDHNNNGENSYDSSGAYRQNDQHLRDQNIHSRGPYYNIHKPSVAHIQVIEEKDDYRQDQKEGQGFGGQTSYGLRNQPRPQYKNYKPSGYTPGMLNAYDPPSPPLSALLPLPGPYRPSEQSDDNSYEDREQSGRGSLPESQQLQQQSQNQMPYGVEVEFDQTRKNEANILRGPGISSQRRPEGYSEGMNEHRGQGGNGGQEYNREQERPDYNDNNENSYENNGNKGQDYENNNQLGPKYNVEDDGPAAQGGYDRRPQQELVKPQSIQYGFIPLSEAKEFVGGPGYRGPEGFRGGRGRPGEGLGNFGQENYRDHNRGYGNNGEGHRRPQQQEFNEQPEGMGVMYGRGPPMENHRPNGFEGNNPNPYPSGPNGFGRKPAFERQPFLKNNGEESYNSGEEEEEMGGDDGDYGKQKPIPTIPLDDNDKQLGANDPNRLPYQCYPWNCNPWHSIHPDSPYNSVGAALKASRQPSSHGSGLPPGASYNPRDVGLDESVVAQLNLAASSPAGIAPGIVPIPPNGFRGGMGVHMGNSRPFPFGNVQMPSAPVQRPQPRPQPYSATGQGFRSQYGYRAAASELSPVSTAQSSSTGANSPVLSNLLNLNPVKNFRSLLSYLTGGING